MQSTREILAVAGDIQSRLRAEIEATEYAYMSRELVQCTLPHSNPGNQPIWKRKNGNLTLTILPGRNELTGKSLGYPYGTLPRLVLFWIVTEAVQTKNPRLILGDSLSDFMRELGLNPSNGGKRSDTNRLKDQARRLFACEINLIYTFETNEAGCRRRSGMKIVEDDLTWWSKKNPQQSDLFGNAIELTEKFFRAITAAPIPLDMAALRRLKRSPLALDLYALTAAKAYHAERLCQAQFVPWSGLSKQLGSNYDASRMDNFQTRIKTTLAKVAACFPGKLQIEYQRPAQRNGHKTEGGIVFLPGSVVPIPPTKISTGSRGKGQPGPLKR